MADAKVSALTAVTTVAAATEIPVNEAGTVLSFETGRLAQLADGAVVVQLGDTMILSTVVTSKPRQETRAYKRRFTGTRCAKDHE